LLYYICYSHESENYSKKLNENQRDIGLEEFGESGYRTGGEMKISQLG